MDQNIIEDFCAEVYSKTLPNVWDGAFSEKSLLRARSWMSDRVLKMLLLKLLK